MGGKSPIRKIKINGNEKKMSLSSTWYILYWFWVIIKSKKIVKNLLILNFYKLVKKLDN